MKLFLDSDLILDVMIKRHRYKDSYHIIELIKNKKFVGYTSSIIFSNIFYIVTLKLNKQAARQTVTKLEKLLQVSPTNQSIVSKSVNSNFTDFEDALQFFTAKAAKIDYFITRNTKHYPQSNKPQVLTPSEFLAQN